MYFKIKMCVLCFCSACVLPLRWSSPESEPVQLWKSVPESTQHLVGQQGGEVAPWHIDHVASFGVNTSADPEREALF